MASAHWRTDKTVSLPMMGVAAIHMVALVWFAATLTARVDQFEKRADGFAPQMEKVIEIKAAVAAMKDDIADIKATLRIAKLGSR